MALAFALTALMVPTVSAEEGRIPIFEPISRSGAGSGGQYVLTRDVTAPEVGGTAGIEIVGTGVEQIEIDLNGFEVTGNNVGDPVIRITNVRGVDLRNGTVSSPVLTGSVIEVAVSGIAGKAIVEDLRVSGGFRGIWLNGVPNFFVRRNIVSGFASSSSEGIAVYAGGFAGTVRFQGAIEDNILQDDGAGGSGSYGIAVYHPNQGTIIRSNTIRAGFTGLQLSSATGALVEGNYVASNAAIGYNFANGDGLRVTNNRAWGTSQHGFYFFNVQDSMITDNVAGECGIHGFFVWNGSSGNLIDRNVANNNGSTGFTLDFDTGNNRYGRNGAYGNTGGCGAGTPACGQANFCDLGTGNVSFGDNLIPGPPPC